MMKIGRWLACAAVLLTLTAGAMSADVGYIECISARQLGAGEDFPGMWEYVYDVYANEAPYFATHGLSGFDASAIVNQWEYDPYQYEVKPQGTLVQYWSWGAAHATGTDECFGSISNDQINWTLHGEAWSMDNPWHAPTDYVGGLSILKAPMWFTGLVNPDDGMSLEYVARRLSGTPLTGLAQTFRIVHPTAPGLVDWWVGTDNDGTSTGTVVGPALLISRPGDFDDDSDIDADDIDALRDAILSGSTDPTYDLNGDGDVNCDDFAFMIHELVDTALGEGTGTEFGDFNLDGMVGILDLGILGDNYNTPGGWAQGNANCADHTIGILDLGLLGDNYGYDGSAIPEPMTMSLLGIGAIAILRRRSR